MLFGFVIFCLAAIFMFKILKILLWPLWVVLKIMFFPLIWSPKKRRK